LLPNSHTLSKEKLRQDFKEGRGKKSKAKNVWGSIKEEGGTRRAGSGRRGLGEEKIKLPIEKISGGVLS